jgi:hypothetical protein
MGLSLMSVECPPTETVIDQSGCRLFRRAKARAAEINLAGLNQDEQKHTGGKRLEAIRLKRYNSFRTN